MGPFLSWQNHIQQVSEPCWSSWEVQPSYPKEEAEPPSSASILAHKIGTALTPTSLVWGASTWLSLLRPCLGRRESTVAVKGWLGATTTQRPPLPARPWAGALGTGNKGQSLLPLAWPQHMERWRPYSPHRPGQSLNAEGAGGGGE